jgi:hypothetical protein
MNRVRPITDIGTNSEFLCDITAPDRNRLETHTRIIAKRLRCGFTFELLCRSPNVFSPIRIELTFAGIRRDVWFKPRKSAMVSDSRSHAGWKRLGSFLIFLPVDRWPQRLHRSRLIKVQDRIELRG